MRTDFRRQKTRGHKPVEAPQQKAGWPAEEFQVGDHHQVPANTVVDVQLLQAFLPIGVKGLQIFRPGVLTNLQGCAQRVGQLVKGFLFLLAHGAMEFLMCIHKAPVETGGHPHLQVLIERVVLHR